MSTSGRFKGARSAPEDSSIYIYIHIYIYIWGPISRVQGSKAGISRVADSAKNDFLLGPVSKCTFSRLQDTRKRVPRAFWMVLGVFWELLGTAKTCDSVQYILQKSAFRGCPVPRHLSMAPLKRFGASGGVRGCFFGPFWIPFLAC